ncbi:DEKNAAC100381 [Brettanomyces naardenensis]|uniref:DEKNAAC100381 n=1 Tax=Brettanomyces naardenensis TaxID=13370 RepID=A0A448YFB6_BRENA|nr:DEKNAAC100381 [Brettanomyces naardenensis]
MSQEDYPVVGDDDSLLEYGSLLNEGSLLDEAEEFFNRCDEDLPEGEKLSDSEKAALFLSLLPDEARELADPFFEPGVPVPESVVELDELVQDGSVSEYSEQFNRLVALLPLGYESPEETIARYVGGLEENIRDFVEFCMPSDLDEAQIFASDVEHRLNVAERLRLGNSSDSSVGRPSFCSGRLHRSYFFRNVRAHQALYNGSRRDDSDSW